MGPITAICHAMTANNRAYMAALKAKNLSMEMMVEQQRRIYLANGGQALSAQLSPAPKTPAPTTPTVERAKKFLGIF